MSTEQPPGPPTPPPEASQFDFWLGEWDTRWGDGLAATNRVTKILGDRVILEEFDGATDAQLRGMSVSVFEPRDRHWRQTWVDDNGSYYDFVGGWEDGPDGGIEGGRMVLVHSREVEGRTVLLRLVWSAIERDAMTWEWQRSDDAGETWRTLWELDYKRRS